MARLSETNYTSRRLNLTQALAAAQAAYQDAAYRFELGHGTAETVAVAREEAQSFEVRIVGLDLAWERTKAENAAAERAAEAESAKAGHTLITKTLATRAEIAVEMNDAAVSLADAFARYQALGHEIVSTALNHRVRFTQDEVRGLRDLIAGSFNDVRLPIGRTLSMGGLDLHGVTVSGFDSDNLNQRHVPSFVDWQNRRVASQIDVLVSEPAEAEAGQ